MSLQECIQIALGQRPAALAIQHVRVFHLTTGEWEEDTDIALDSQGRIAAVGRGYDGVEVVPGKGLVAVPGFIDAHMHLESSLMIPRNYERMVTAYGVTTAVCDLHELANVVGEAAFDYCLQASQAMAMSLLVRISPCVPATPLETSGFTVDAQCLRRWRERHPELGLGELMNVPGVLNRDGELMAKVEGASFLDGHCPMVTGRALNAYLATGVRNDHESSTLEEAREKLRRGLQVLIREGSAARNLEALLPLMTLENSMRLGFCTDDRNPLDMEEEGHLDAMVRRAIRAGIPPLVAYRVASYSAAQGLGLTDRGLIAPGMRGDILLLSDWKECRLERVFVAGVPRERLFQKGRKDAFPSEEPFLHTVKCRPMTPEDFPLPPRDGRLHPVIGVLDGSLLTERLSLPADAPGVLPVAVVERHGKNGNVGRGLVRGFALKAGALASSVGHDSHNLCVVGTSPQAMAEAANALRESQGGFVAVRPDGTRVLLPLPVGGLMSQEEGPVLADRLRELHQAARELGCPLHAPFLQLAFVPLAVIPHLKLTDRGLVDVDAFRLLSPGEC